MTFFLPPDYDLALEITQGDFEKIAGIPFTCGIAIADGGGHFSGMLIVPEARGLASVGRTTEASLWADNDLSSPVDTRVQITIGDPCDLQFLSRFKELAAHKGLAFAGIITRILTSDAEWDNTW